MHDAQVVSVEKLPDDFQVTEPEREAIMAKLTQPAAWVMHATSKYIGAEKGEVGCLRFGMCAVRIFAVASFADLCASMEQMGIAKPVGLETGYHYEQVVHFLTSMDDATMTSMGLQWGMAVVDDVVYVPQGCVFMDQPIPGTSGPVLGLKLPVVVNSVNQASLEQMQLYFAATGSIPSAKGVQALLAVSRP